MADTTNIHWHNLPVRRGFDSVKEIFDLLDGRGYIAGSYAAYMSFERGGFQPNDVDIFAVSNEDATALVTELQADLGYHITSQNDVAYTLHKTAYLPVQLVRPSPEWTNFPDDILNSFDMNICRGVLISPGTLLGDMELGFTRGKLLRMHNPLRTLKRVMKYQVRGIEFNDHELLKLFRAWQEMTPERQQAMLDQAHAEAFPSDSNDQDYEDWYDDDDDWFEGE